MKYYRMNITRVGNAVCYFNVDRVTKPSKEMRVDGRALSLREGDEVQISMLAPTFSTEEKFFKAFGRIVKVFSQNKQIEIVDENSLLLFNMWKKRLLEKYPEALI